jgi:hypothetical protein
MAATDCISHTKTIFDNRKPASKLFAMRTRIAIPRNPSE